MNILEIISSRHWIGEAAHVFNLAKQLHDRQHNITLVTKKGWKIAEKASDAGLSPIGLEMNGHFNIKDNTGDITKLVKIIKKSNPDVIHCHRGQDHWLSLIALKISGKKIPLVRTRHVNVPVRTHAFNRWLYYNTNEIICVAEHIFRGYEKSSLVPQEKLHLIYTGADVTEFDFKKDGSKFRAEFNISDDAPLVGIVGRIAAIKGQQFLAKAAPAIKEKFPNVKFILAGEEKSKSSMEKLIVLIEERGLEQDFIFTGYRKDIAEVVGAFDAALIASKGSEGSSRACYEYMAMKKPIVATSVGILPELIENGKNGLLISPKSPDAISSAICKILGDRDFAKKIGETAYNDLRDKFNFGQWIEKTEVILKHSAGK